MIQLQDLTKSFGDRVLLDHVTWQITDRERVGLCGPNGAGKTTLLRMVAGLDEKFLNSLKEQMEAPKRLGELREFARIYSSRLALFADQSADTLPML